LPKKWLQRIEASFFLFLFIEQQPKNLDYQGAFLDDRE
jgi:hypothetical protein